MPTGVYTKTKEHGKLISLANKGKHFSVKTEFKKGQVSINKGKKLSQETKDKISKNNGMRGKKMSNEQKEKIKEGLIKSGNTGAFKKGYIPWNKGRKYVEIMGEKHPNWQGGITEINQSIRASFEYKLWRKSVFERDNYTCIWCGEKGNKLNADHIKPFCNYPELRFAIDNGRTLCEACHKTTSTYGVNAKKH